MSNFILKYPDDIKFVTFPGHFPQLVEHLSRGKRKNANSINQSRSSSFTSNSLIKCLQLIFQSAKCKMTVSNSQSETYIQHLSVDLNLLGIFS